MSYVPAKESGIPLDGMRDILETLRNIRRRRLILLMLPYPLGVFVPRPWLLYNTCFWLISSFPSPTNVDNLSVVRMLPNFLTVFFVGALVQAFCIILY